MYMANTLAIRLLSKNMEFFRYPPRTADKAFRYRVVNAVSSVPMSYAFFWDIVTDNPSTCNRYYLMTYVLVLFVKQIIRHVVPYTVCLDVLTMWHCFRLVASEQYFTL